MNEYNFIQPKADLSIYELPQFNPPELEIIKSCTRCPLSPSKNIHCKKIAPGVGSLNGHILVVAEALGFYETEFGYPLIGASHDILQWLAGSFSMSLREFFEIAFVTNSAKCRTDDQNRDPTDKELNACKDWTEYIIDNMPNLKLIVCIGRIAAKHIEGDQVNISLRQGIPAKINWIPRSLMYERKQLISTIIYHPAYIKRFKNPYGKERILREYLAQLPFIRKVSDSIRDVGDLSLVDPSRFYNFKVPQTAEESLEVAYELTRSDAEWTIWDFESGRTFRQTAVPTFLAVSTARYDAIGFYLKQSVLLPKDKQYRIKKKSGKRSSGTGFFTVTEELIPWFDMPDYETKLMNILRPYIENVVPYLSAYNSNFERRLFWDNYNIKFHPREAQVREANDVDLGIPPYDILTFARLCTSQLQRVNLQTILNWLMSLEASTKDIIHSVLGDSAITQTGFQYMFRKNPLPLDEMHRIGLLYNDYLRDKSECLLSTDQIALCNRYWIPDYSMTRQEIGATRALFDTYSERSVYSGLLELLTSDRGEQEIATNLLQGTSDDIFNIYN